MKRIISLLLVLVLCLGLFAGCGSKAPATDETEAPVATEPKAPEVQDPAEESGLKADITFWSSYTETSNYGQVILAAADAFMKENPGVTIEVSFQGTDIQSTLGPALQAGTKITMFEANTDASTRLWLDQMMDLEEYFNTVYPESNGKTYGESIIGAYNVLSKVQGNGKYVYFPYTPQFITIWYNMDIFDACGITEKPETWNELMDICQILVDNGYTPFTSDQGHIHMALGYYLQRRLGGEAAEALATSTTGEEWNDPAVLEVIKEFEKAASKGYYAKNITTVVQPEAQQEMVIDQKIAMYVCGSWMPNNLRESAGEDFRWGSIRFPLVENGVDDGSSLSYGCYGISINKDATKEEADAAAAFAVHLTTGEWGDYLVAECNAIPVTEGTEWPAMVADASDIFDGVTNRWTAHTAMVNTGDLLPIIKSALAKLMAGDITAEQFLEEVTAYYE